VEFHHAGVALFRYVYQSQVDAWETAEPYIHPLRTLSGEVVTNFRPHDHVWHHGLTMTMGDIKGENFWGGKTYDRATAIVRRSFEGGRILAADGLEGPEVLGKRAAWLAFTGRHDGSAQASTLVFVDDESNPHYPTPWFVRTRPYPGVAFSFVFDDTCRLAPGASLALRYHLIVADGDWDRERIGQEVSASGQPAGRRFA
jgi:hypothetical protein